MSGVVRRRLLIVDDSSDDLEIVVDLIRRERPSWEVIEERTGSEAVHRVLRDAPDCVLLDYFLPDMRAGDFLAALAPEEGEGAVPVPVVVLTGDDSDLIATEVLGRGAQDYLLKDAITARGLVRSVENAIGKHQILEELGRQRAAVQLRNRKLELLREELQARLAELSDAQKARDRFLAVMSHEMRTPLNAILGYTDLLEMELEGRLTSGQRGQLERIRVGGRHLLDLINDVLDLARADARKLELDIRPVDLRAVLEEVVALLESQAAAKGVGLVVEVSEELPQVQGDLQRLRQVVTNLIGNAIKFTERGQVTIRCRPGEAGTIQVEVSDTGIGIAREVLPFIFDEFYQVRGELTREKGGSGLGLAISQRLVRLMGGTIEARSVLGHGSVFTVTLPIASQGLRDAARPLSPEPSRSGEVPAQGPAAVVVVAFGDDAGALQELQRQVRHGVRLSWTTDVDAVPGMVARENAVLVVLDVSAANGAAWKAAHGIQETASNRAAVLLLPGIPAGAGGEAGGGLDLGWVSLIPKPFTPDQLSQAVSAAAMGYGAGEPRTGAPVDVLVVDDDPDSRRVAARILGEVHAHVREAQDGESALEQMRLLPPDVVVLDLMMPVLDGFGVLATMRADPALAHLPVVVLTAKSLNEAEREFLARTAARVLQKGEHRLADVASLVLRAASRTQRPAQVHPGGTRSGDAPRAT